MKTWLEVKALLPGTPEDWSAWTYVFERHDLLGTVQTDHPPTMSAYLAPGQEDALEPLRADLLAFGATNVVTRQVAEEDWAESWKQFFKPRRIGQRIVVRPSWEPFEVLENDIEIVLDPGQAFGTGDHPTTRGCLELLEETPLVGKQVADIGCGSGILSVAAARLGAESVVGVDSDPVSVEASLENAERNRVSITAFAGLGFMPLDDSATFDVVVSNIISAALISLASEAGRRVRENGYWIVSGIIEANWPDVLAAAESNGFKLDRKIVEGDWVSARLIR